MIYRHVTERAETPLNAISPRRPRETQEERTDRFLDTCRELADLGMRVARVTAACATADYAPAEPPPGAAEHAAAEPAEPPAIPILPARRTCAALAFARASRAVRQAIALEARIVAGEPLRTPRGVPDPRRAAMQRALHHATRDHPDRRDIEERLDHEISIAEDADIPTVFASICNDLDITPDLATLPDEMLGMNTEPVDCTQVTDWPAFLAAYYGEPIPSPHRACHHPKLPGTPLKGPATCDVIQPP